MKTINAIILAIVVAIVCIGGTALYFQKQAPSNTMNVEAGKALVKKVTKGKAVILKSFKIDEHKLQGFVVKGTGTNAPEGVLFTDPAGTFVISGNVMNGKGVNFARVAYAKFIAPARAAKAFAEISKVAYVTDGKATAAHKMYVIADPNCIFCHRLYENTRPLVKAGTLQIRWIMGGLLKASSKGKAATILSAQDPAQELSNNEKGFNEKTETGSSAVMENIPADVMAKIKANSDFMIKHNFLQTPALLYKNKEGTAKLFTGLPQGKQLTALLSNMSNKY